MRNTLLSLSLLGLSASLPAATLTENFDNITTLVGNGWFFQNNSSPLGSTGYFQGNDTVFAAHQGAADAYIGANYNNTSGVGTISNWLLTPQLLISNGDTFSFFTRTVASPFAPDRLQLRLSTSGASTNVGTLATDVGDFTNLLLDINPSLTTTGYPNAWTQYTATVSGLGAPTNGRFAFRYFVTNGGSNGTNSDYIGIDTVAFNGAGSAVPEPATWIAAASVLTLLAARRRR